MIRDINKYSNNVMAQQLFLTLSLQQKGLGTPAGSREVLSQWWRRRFGEADLPSLDNGSGLSRDTRVSAQALTRLLQAAWAGGTMPELLSSLPLSGVDGTLRRLGKDNAAVQGAAHLKTGSLRDVTAVAGVVHGASGRALHPGGRGQPPQCQRPAPGDRGLDRLDRTGSEPALNRPHPMSLTDLTGYLAACLTTCSFVPQAWLTFKTRDVRGAFRWACTACSPAAWPCGCCMAWRWGPGPSWRPMRSP